MLDISAVDTELKRAAETAGWVGTAEFRKDGDVLFYGFEWPETETAPEALAGKKIGISRTASERELSAVNVSQTEMIESVIDYLGWEMEQQGFDPKTGRFV